MNANSLILVFAAATLAPLIGGLVFGPRVPPIVLEIVLGVIIGPAVLGWAHKTSNVTIFATLGLSFLFFMAGLEIDWQRIAGRPSQLATVTWFVSIVLGLGVGAALQGSGVVLSSLLVGIALTTTALGTLLPILRDSGEIDTAFGTLVMGAGTVGEFGPIILVSTLLTGSSLSSSLGAILTFAALALAIAVTALKMQPPKLLDVVGRTMHSSAQLPVRLTVLLVVGLVFLTTKFGLDAVLGAFAAGVIVSLVIGGGGQAEVLREKLDAVSFGIFIPVFFVTTGLTFDLKALESEAALWRLPVFLALFLVVRGVPALLLYRTDLPRFADRIDFALLTSTQLPLIVAITEIGLATHKMRPSTAAALVGAGMLSVLLFPLITNIRRARRGPAPETAAAEAAA